MWSGLVACIHACMHPCMHACMRACVRACMHAYTCICMHMHACMHGLFPGPNSHLRLSIDMPGHPPKGSQHESQNDQEKPCEAQPATVPDLCCLLVMSWGRLCLVGNVILSQGVVAEPTEPSPIRNRPSRLRQTWPSPEAGSTPILQSAEIPHADFWKPSGL